MSAAARPVAIFVIGSPKEARRVKPSWPSQPVRTKRPGWPDERSFPKPPPIDRQLLEEMRERARRAISDARPEIEAMLKSARALRIAARERRTGVPFVPYAAA